MQYDAIIFDNDGVLTTPTPEPVWRAANRIAYQRQGGELPVPPAIERLDGRSLPDLQVECYGHGIDHQEFWETREAVAIRAQLSELRKGSKTVYGDVGALHSLDPSLGVVSNNHQAIIDAIVEQFGLDDVVETHYGRTPTIAGLRRMKPNSHYLERAIEDLDANNPLYVGDSDVDVRAASTLGIDVAFVRRDHRKGYELSQAPTYELSSLFELQGLLDSTTRTAKLF